MKNVLYLLFIGLILITCAQKQEQSSAGEDEWPEMDAFHMTMAEAFHPLKDSGNVEPALRLMGQLADEAEKWAAAPLPEKMNNDAVKNQLEKLKTDLRVLADDVKNGAHADTVGATLHTIHDQFHEIMEAWHKGGN